MFLYRLFTIYIFYPLFIFLWSTNILEHMQNLCLQYFFVWNTPPAIQNQNSFQIRKNNAWISSFSHFFNVKSKESDHIDFKSWFWYSMIQHKSTLNQSACRTNEVLIIFERTRSSYLEIILWKEFNIISQLLFFLLNFGLHINLENYVTFEETKR